MKLLRIFKGYRQLEEKLRDRNHSAELDRLRLERIEGLLSRFFHNEIVLKKLNIDFARLSISAFWGGPETEFSVLLDRLDREIEQQKFEEKVRAVKCQKNKS